MQVGLLPLNKAVSSKEQRRSIYIVIPINDNCFEKNETQNKDTPYIDRHTAFKCGSKHKQIQEVVSNLTFQ